MSRGEQRRSPVCTSLGPLRLNACSFLAFDGQALPPGSMKRKRGDPMRINATTLQAAAISAALLTTGAARADNSPLGLWIDHTGRGGVEIKECNGNKLCGHIVWLKDNKNLEACGEQVLGDVKPVGSGKW